jgi:hypothetical protein
VNGHPALVLRLWPSDPGAPDGALGVVWEKGSDVVAVSSTRAGPEGLLAFARRVAMPAGHDPVVPDPGRGRGLLGELPRGWNVNPRLGAAIQYVDRPDAPSRGAGVTTLPATPKEQLAWRALLVDDPRLVPYGERFCCGDRVRLPGRCVSTGGLRGSAR